MFNGISWKNAPAGGYNENEGDNGGVGENDDEDECVGIKFFVFTIQCAFRCRV